MNEREATCSCGQLVVRSQGEPVRVSICHCFACQKRTGSVFGAQAKFPVDAVTVLGNSKQYTQIADSDHAVLFQFCPECGSAVCWQLDALPGFIMVAVGAFADPNFPAPMVSVYADRQCAWLSLPENMEHID